MRRNFIFRSKSMGVFAALLLFASATLAGPPLICHAFDIGNAKSLPWVSHSWNLNGGENYDTARLAADTQSILNSDSTILVHMETLRRATLYARKDPHAAKELFVKLFMAAKTAQTDGNATAMAFFDAGYLAETYKQWLVEQNPAKDVDGYALIKHAISIRGNDPQMEFAAALVTLGGPEKNRSEHAQKALAGAQSDSLLARNLASHFWGPESEKLSEMITKTTVAKEIKR
jgi:hypothetical protein